MKPKTKKKRKSESAHGMWGKHYSKLNTKSRDI